MKNTFKVYEENGEIYLDPDFEVENLNDWEKEVYNHQKSHFENPPIHIYANDARLFHPPEEITFRELWDRYNKKNFTDIGPDPEEFDG